MQLTSGQPAAGFGYLAGSKSTFIEIAATATSNFAYGIQSEIDSSTECITPKQQNEIRFMWQHDYADRAARLPLWYVKERLGGQRQRLEMRLSEEPGTSLVPLAELARVLHNGETTPLNLQRLNQLAEMLFGLARTMGKHGLSLGLIDPGNVFFIPETDEDATLPIRKVVLTDLFLVPRRDDAPAWIVNRDNYNFIWKPEYETPDGDSVEERRKYLRHQSQQATYDAQRDARCVARMFAWLLTGKAMNEIPVDIALSAPIWDEFRRLLNEREGSAEEISTAIQEHKLSDALMPSTPEHDSSTKRGVLWLGLLGGITALLCVVAVLVSNRKKPEENGPVAEPYFMCMDCPLDSKLHSHFHEKQVPLIAEFRKMYRYEEDSDVWESSTPSTINPMLFNLDVLSAQSVNLQSQLTVIEGAFALAIDDGDFACIANELGRIQTAFGDHVIVVDGASSNMAAVHGMKATVREMMEIGRRIDYALSRKEIDIPADPKIVQELAADPELEGELAELFSPAARLGSTEAARMYVVTIRSLGSE